MVNSAGLFIFDSRDLLLVCVPYGGKDISNGYTVPKGKVENNETPLQAAIRETYEESGLNFTSNPPFFFLSMGSQTYKSKKKRIHGFAAQLDYSLDPLTCKCSTKTEDNHPEIIEYYMVTVQDAIKHLHPAQSQLLDRYIKGTNE